MTSLRWSVENSQPPCHTFLIHAIGLGTTLLRTLQLCGQAFGGNPTSSPSPRRYLLFPTFCDPTTTPDNLQVGRHGTGGEPRGRRDGLRRELRSSCPGGLGTAWKIATFSHPGTAEMACRTDESCVGKSKFRCFGASGGLRGPIGVSTDPILNIFTQLHPHVRFGTKTGTAGNIQVRSRCTT